MIDNKNIINELKEQKGKLLRPHIVASLLEVSRDSIYRLIRQGDLDFIRTSPRNIRIYKSSVDKYLKKLNKDNI